MPISVALLEYIFLGREAPSLRSWLSLLGITIGAIGYVTSDEQFLINGWDGYYWAMFYVSILSLDMTYGKKLTNEVHLTIWGSVYYTNLMSVILLSIICFFEQERTYNSISEIQWTTDTMILTLLSCVMSTGISYAGWNCRSLISATSYTVVGVLNKLLTIILGFIFFEEHAHKECVMYLILCLIAGSFYTQAPLKSDKKNHDLHPLRDRLPS